MNTTRNLGGRPRKPPGTRFRETRCKLDPTLWSVIAAIAKEDGVSHYVATRHVLRVGLAALGKIAPEAKI